MRFAEISCNSLAIRNCYLIIFKFFPRKIESIIDVERKDIDHIKVDYDLLEFENYDESSAEAIVIDDKDDIQKLLNILKGYKYSGKYLLFEPDPKSNERIRPTGRSVVASPRPVLPEDHHHVRGF